jgi:hypothetical protein
MLILLIIKFKGIKKLDYLFEMEILDILLIIILNVIKLKLLFNKLIRNFMGFKMRICLKKVGMMLEYRGIMGARLCEERV